MEDTQSNTQVVGDITIKDKTSISEKGWKKNIVKDLTAPAYYSQQAIWAFSTFFTVIFGAVLLYINLKGNKKGQFVVLGFGIIYTVLAAILITNISTNTGIVIAINAIGGFILTQLFWDKYLGEETKYRTRPVLMPLLISILITIPFIILMVFQLMSGGTP